MINDMYSRSGKATENMHLTLANVKKLKRQELSSSAQPETKMAERRNQIQNSKPIVRIISKFDSLAWHVDRLRDRGTLQVYSTAEARGSRAPERDDSSRRRGEACRQLTTPVQRKDLFEQEEFHCGLQVNHSVEARPRA